VTDYTFIINCHGNIDVPIISLAGFIIFNILAKAALFGYIK